VLNKVLTDFGEAVILGVKAISEGQVTPMNPNEPLRSQVFLHNNIFFSRAVDAGLETFKVAKGDKAARKSASRDLHCLGALHRMERTGLHTLATAVVDYLGSRFVCQSILPGILSGEKTHTLLYGAVETGIPLVWDKEMHELFETTLGKGLMIATRPMAKQPLTPERIAEIEDAKSDSPFIRSSKLDDEEKGDGDNSQTIELCAPLEAKGIRGSDQRKYVLDMTRLTPRDANWIPKEKGGTGKWDSVVETTSCDQIPDSLDDEEWTLAVLRSELVSLYAQMKMAKYVQDKRASAEGDKKDSPDDDKKDSAENGDEKKKDVKPSEEDLAEKKRMSEDDLAYLSSLRFNVNVFLPDIETLENIDPDAFEQIKKDEDMVREAAVHLWDNVIPGVTNEIRMGTVHTVPHDGKSLTEFIHQRGINCRYLGRLAKLALLEEEKDQKQLRDFKENKISKLDRRKMPLFWLELLECEMVSRAAKHVLDRHLSANNYANVGSLSQIVASFLCALVSEGEETAAQTENRMRKSENVEPDEDDLSGLTLYQRGSTVSHLRSRRDVWTEIEEEIGRRFRYSLTIFNQATPNDRTLYMPLLRRVCQRNGIRLVAKSYDVGKKCMCSDAGAGGSLIASYPLSALDVVDIVPLMKHAAAHSEGFVACGSVPTTGLPALHISLPDARATLEQAHLYHNKRLLSRALDLAQEAAGLYQRVSETPAHPGVVRCIDLIASILYDAGESALAAQNAARALGLQTQISGFDSPDIINLHFVMFQFLLAAGEASKAIKHIKAAIYLMEMIGGKNHLELSNAYHKAGTVYHGVNDLNTALRFYQEATSRDSCDRLLEAMVSKSSALVLAGVGDFKQAVENEKRAFQLFSVLLGQNHTLTKQSDQALNNFMRAAVEHGNRMVDDLKKKREEEAAEAIAFEIEAEEAAEEVRRKKKNQKRKKGKKH
jgi:protein TIF31